MRVGDQKQKYDLEWSYAHIATDCSLHLRTVLSGMYIFTHFQYYLTRE